MGCERMVGLQGAPMRSVGAIPRRGRAGGKIRTIRFGAHTALLTEDEITEASEQ